MGKVFRIVRMVSIALATVAAGRRAWQQYQSMKEAKKQGPAQETWRAADH